MKLIDFNFNLGAFLEAAKLFGYKNIDLNGATQTGFAIPQGNFLRF